jgi:hypothetical protein
VCNARNINVPVDISKAEFELIENGVEFYHVQFKLDSNHSEYRYLVAKIVMIDETWQLMVAHRDEHNRFERWHAYPSDKFKGQQLHNLMHEIEHDPLELIW